MPVEEYIAGERSSIPLDQLELINLFGEIGSCKEQMITHNDVVFKIAVETNLDKFKITKYVCTVSFQTIPLLTVVISGIRYGGELELETLIEKSNEARAITKKHDREEKYNDSRYDTIREGMKGMPILFYKKMIDSFQALAKKENIPVIHRVYRSETLEVDGTKMSKEQWLRVFEPLLTDLGYREKIRGICWQNDYLP